MKKVVFILSITLCFFSFSMEKSIENQTAIFSNDSDQPIFLDSSAIQYSPLLKVFFESRKEYLKENIKINLPYEQLKKALNIIDLFLETKKDESKESDLTNSLQQLSLQELINTYFVADYFKIIELEKKYLGLLFNKPKFIEQLAQLDKEQLQSLEFIKTKDFLPGQAPNPLLENVRDIFWSPDKSRYFVKFQNETAQLFDKNGNPIRDLLRNVFSVNWSPDGLRYFIKFIGSGQLFDKDGNSRGDSDVSSVYWSPDGSYYFATLIDSGQLFDKNSNSIGAPLRNAFSASWSPDGSRYFVFFHDQTAQLFDKDGNSIENVLNNVDYIYWSSDGSRYFVMFRDNSGRFFDNNGNSIENVLSNVHFISWSPDGSRYFIKFFNDSAQLFDIDGNSIGNPLSNVFQVNWSPYGSHYFVKFKGNLGQLFDKEGNPIENLLSNVHFISWSPNGSRYFVKFTDGSESLFDKEDNLILNFFAKTIWNPDNTLMVIDYSDNNLYENELKFLVKKVQDGYQIYRAKDKLHVGAPLQNKPLWIDTNSFKIEEDDGQEKYYSYQELALPDLVTKAAVSGKTFREAWKATS